MLYVSYSIVDVIVDIIVDIIYLISVWFSVGASTRANMIYWSMVLLCCARVLSTVMGSAIMIML